MNRLYSFTVVLFICTNGKPLSERCRCPGKILRAESCVGLIRDGRIGVPKVLRDFNNRNAGLDHRDRRAMTHHMRRHVLKASLPAGLREGPFHRLDRFPAPLDYILARALAMGRFQGFPCFWRHWDGCAALGRPRAFLESDAASNEVNLRPFQLQDGASAARR